VSKSIEDNFRDWEGHVFGFGYGSGEPHVLPALRAFLSLCDGENSTYNHHQLEAELTPVVSWLLINALCRHGRAIEYGTSPRCGWLTDSGKRLRSFVLSKTDEELIEIVTDAPDYYFPCYPDTCNCGPNGYEEGRICENQFWGRRK
jgi:hypothetical protein